jgi:hypothetical protein
LRPFSDRFQLSAVLCSRGILFGASFVADIDPTTRETKVTSSSSRRTSSRDSLFLSATIRRKGDVEEELVPLRVRNLSAVGLMADYHDVAVEGEPVVVTVRGIGSVAGTVAWIKQGRIGIAFDVEVDPKLARKPIKPEPVPLSRPLRPLF